MGVETVIATAAITAAVASAAGAGLSFYGQQQQAQAASRMAEYNYQVQLQQMQMQAQMDQLAADQQYQAGLQNAAVYESEAMRVEQEALERARRMREENERLLGEQRARFGAAGVTSEGTPLTIMAESAGLMEMAVSDELYRADLERTSLYRQAEVEKWQAGYSLIDKAAAEYNLATARYRATPILIEGQNTASALSTNSYGSLISGVGNVAQIGMNYDWKSN